MKHIHTFESFVNEGKYTLLKGASKDARARDTEESDREYIAMRQKRDKESQKMYGKDYRELDPKQKDKVMSSIRESVDSFESLVNEGKSFKSLKDIEVAIKHLIPNAKLEKGHSFPSLKIVGDGYIALDIPNSKKYVIIAYTRSEYGTGTTGVLWVYGDRHRGFEFTTIEELHSLLKKEADLKESVN